MTTREQLEQEAYELYPESYDAETGHHVDDWGFSECQREAHVRAKTITAEQVEQAAKAWSDAEIEAYGVGLFTWSQRDEREKDYIRSFACAALESAGLYVEGEE